MEKRVRVPPYSTMIFDYFFLRLGAGYAKMAVLWLGARLVAEFEKCDKFSIFLKILKNEKYFHLVKVNGENSRNLIAFSV